MHDDSVYIYVRGVKFALMNLQRVGRFVRANNSSHGTTSIVLLRAGKIGVHGWLCAVESTQRGRKPGVGRERGWCVALVETSAARAARATQQAA